MPRDILLVGGVGLDSAEDVFRTLGKELGPRVKRLTDGETGFARSVSDPVPEAVLLRPPAAGGHGARPAEPGPAATGARAIEGSVLAHG